MTALLGSLSLLALAIASIEAVLVRMRLPWRAYGADLFVQSSALWFVVGLLALVPALVTARVIERFASPASDAADPRRRAARRVGCLLAWMVIPVAAHAMLDRHVGFANNLSGLGSVGPWLEVAGASLVTALVSLGVAFVVRRFWSRGLSVGVALVATLVGLFLPLDTASAPAADGASGADRPNLLLIVWDTCRPDRLEPYGYERGTTPHLARFAESSIVFERAVSPATFTFSSHLSMLTGVYPSTHGARLLSTQYDPRRADAIAETLRRAGYRTGAFVGTDVLAGRTGIRHGFEVYDDRVDPAVCDTRAWKLAHDLQAVGARFVPALRGNGRPHWFQDFQRPASEVLSAARAWIESEDEAGPPGRPWFCFVNLYDVHWPYLPRADGLALVDEYTGPLDGYVFRSDAWTPGYEMTAADKRHVVELYEAEILELDRDVDRFFATLDLDAGGTAVLLTSDHGEAFGEDGHWNHEDPFEPEVRIPMILRLPERAPTGRRVSGRVSGVDVAPTLLDLAGIEDTGGAHAFEGESLLAEHAGDRVIFIEDRDHLDPNDVRIALYRGDWKLRRWGLGEEVWYELYDLARNEWDSHDISADHPQVFEEMKALLAERRDALDRDEGAWSADSDGMAGAADGLQALGYTGE